MDIFPIEQLEIISSQLELIVISAVADDKGLLDKVMRSGFQGNVVEAGVTKRHKNFQCGYENVNTLGIDRWLAVIGAGTLYPEQDCLVVDIGTATTIDGVKKDGRHLGGIIAPGPYLMERSIIDIARGVFTDDSASVEAWPTRTADALRTGCIRSTIALIESTHSEMIVDSKLVLTGGYANVISKELNIDHVIERDLIFEGLKSFIPGQ
jgi:type III pantothenate kinase